MRTAVVLLVAAVLCLSVAAAWSYPTFDGGSGIVTQQTAEVTPTGSVDLALDYQKTQGIQMWPLRAAIGVADKGEVWLGYNHLRDTDLSESGRIWNIGGKYMLMTEPKNQISLAVGAGFGNLDLEGTDSVDITKAFVVATKNLSMKQVASVPVAAKASLGLLYTRLGSPVSESATEPYVGIDFTAKSGGSLGLEYRFKGDSIETDAVFSAVVRYPVGDKANPVWLEVGTTNGAAGVGLNEQKIFFGVGYRWGAFKESGPVDPTTHSGPWGY
jgi:hypothetical protein